MTSEPTPGDDAGDFVARGGQGILLRAPVTPPNSVDVRVADAGELDIDVDVVRTDLATFDGGQGQVARGRGGAA